MNIQGLKESISADDVKKFKFGDADANNDKMLSRQCFCSIRGISEIISGNKRYVLGVKGSGKTAIFKLIRENILQIKINDNEPFMVYAFDDNIQFDIIKSFISENIRAKGNISISTKYQLVWEIYIIHSILFDIKNGVYKNNISENLKNYIDLFEKAFNFKERKGLISLLNNIKASVSFVYEQVTQIWVPSFSFEKNEKKKNKDASMMATEQIEINIQDVKNEISFYLKKTNRSIVIMFDRLDDFVTKSAYNVQRGIIGALIRVERSYLNYENMHLIIFLRNDLFERVDFTDIGLDKIITSVTELKWHPENIREFISKRILTIYINTLGMNFRNIRLINSSKWRKKDGFIKQIKEMLFHSHKRGRSINMSDEQSTAIIRSLFENDIFHYNETGNYENIPFINFLATHFCLADGFSNPRIILIFLELLMEEIRENIEDNFISQYPFDSSTYKIFTANAIAKVYDKFQSLINKIFSNIDNKYKAMFDLLIEKKGARKIIVAKEIFDYLKDYKTEEVKDFIIFLEHILYIKNKTRSNTPIIKRRYELPILFREVEKAN
jgi:hypothetical protein